MQTELNTAKDEKLVDLDVSGEGAEVELEDKSHGKVVPETYEEVKTEEKDPLQPKVEVQDEKQSDEMEKRQKEMKRQYNKGNNKGGRVIRTTSDAGELEDYFDRINAEMRENDAWQGNG